jgi:hypothetical protein
VQAFKPVASALVMTVPHILVNIAWFNKQLKDGVFEADAENNQIANDMLDELVRLNTGLTVVRQIEADASR